LNVAFQVGSQSKVWWLRFLESGKEEGRKPQVLVKASNSPKKVGVTRGPTDLTASHGLFQIIRKALTEEKRVSTKTSAADLVTETDHRVEDLIVSELRKRFPSHR
jgi:fructose-1,6-bisphosphatase/inositol monophosphatase family enzyme